MAQLIFSNNTHGKYPSKPLLKRFKGGGSCQSRGGILSNLQGLKIELTIGAIAWDNACVFQPKG